MVYYCLTEYTNIVRYPQHLGTLAAGALLHCHLTLADLSNCLAYKYERHRKRKYEGIYGCAQDQIDTTLVVL